MRSEEEIRKKYEELWEKWRKEIHLPEWYRKVLYIQIEVLEWVLEGREKW